jgi:hypothetical protein
MTKLPRTPRWFWVALAVLSCAAAWLGVNNQKEHVTADQECRQRCHPLPGQIKGEKRIPNAPEGWRNYPTRPKCVCG